jgi:hypothetical protein
MAKIVLGIATSHGPMLGTPPERWCERVEADRRSAALYFRGRPYDFQQLLAEREGEQLQREVTPARMQERYDACQTAITVLSETYSRVAPDVGVIIGDDQQEIFLDDNMPAFSVFWGDSATNGPLTESQLGSKAPGLSLGDWCYHPPQRMPVPIRSALGKHLIRALIGDGFDVAHSRRLPAGRYGQHYIPHAYGFVYRRIMNDVVIPNVPVFINTFYPPNQPTLARCYAMGQALRRAIESWDGDETVAVMASGGLSHFVIEEDLDQQVLAALRDADGNALVALPIDQFESGTSEIRNWIALAGALDETGLRMRLVDYVPCYRSEAGTGNAMGFVQWT